MLVGIPVGAYKGCDRFSLLDIRSQFPICEQVFWKRNATFSRFDVILAKKDNF